MKLHPMIQRLFPIIGGFVILLALITGVTLADNGPHGGYSATTDACAGCHRAHTAVSAKLLVNTVPALCYTCHGNSGTGADTNVVDGVYLERDTVAESPAEGSANRGLKAGGFQFALIDTDVLTTTTAVITTTTSTHLADGTTGTAWGNGAINPVADPGLTGFSLSCVSCHDPHGGGSSTGGATYRLLRAQPLNSGAATGVDVTDEVTKTYSVDDSYNGYMRQSYGARDASLASWCSQCHTRYLAASGSGHTDSGDAIFTYRHSTTNVSCVRCHVAHGTTATMGRYSGAVAWPDTAVTPNGDARSSLLRLDNRGVCANCHVKADGSVSGGACDACHGAPPATGAHLKHAGADAVGYGLTGSFATGTDYQYGCGECHPTDLNQHQNGSVDTDLSAAGSPVGSLKARNGAAAAFNGSSCADAYCHSGIQITSGAVGMPLTDGSGNAILDAHGNLTYDPYTVTETAVYQTTPDWNSGAISGVCTDCHQFPLTTPYPSVEAGVGNSHQWIDDYGYGNLHAFNMAGYYDPIPCRTCHYGEITDANTWTTDGMDVTSYDPVPLSSRVLHANGSRDVTFDTVNPVVYDNGAGSVVTYTLNSAAYIPVEQACTNVACHQLQNYVQWGSPYRWWVSGECDLCHRMFLPTPPPLSGLPMLQNQTMLGTQVDNVHQVAKDEGVACAKCHEQPHSRVP